MIHRPKIASSRLAPTARCRLLVSSLRLSDYGRGGLRSGRTPEELPRGFEPLMQSVRTWVAAELAEGRREEALSGGRRAVPSEHAIRPIGAT